MAMLFIAGVMNLVSFAALAIIVLAENVVLGGRLVARLLGAALIGLETWMLARPP